MTGPMAKFGMAAILVAGLSACGGGTPDLVTLRSTQPGPDEFAVLPNRPLETPPDLSALPVPTPGGANRSDQTPVADAVAALGGNPAAVPGGGVRGPDLVTYARRYGVEPGIRGTLAAADLEYRRERPGLLLERVFGTDTYTQAYGPLALDPYAELERMRARGVRTPAAPPPER
ncbi:beta-barrel assembly complex subunit BamF [Palleronia aestuarii]|uniref:Beta-barrel assembly complex subunit BamF n=1 Tax=Palleronia aestuarii TaxID=568105 RepID=A0A2W7N6T1_9RHOB|nr:DUF3035 domain-containing protein [Palleronia aestuarii]PZX15811.1 beta-barrel assembly complex subunit BamF [Palleronia aestuarii]